MEVKLTWYEVLTASQTGCLRQLTAIRDGRKMSAGLTTDGWSEHIEGACGELAVAKALNVFWDGSVNTFKQDDLPGLQVRTRRRHEYDLIVRPSDDDDARWVLVTGRCPAYRVRGWILGSDAKQPEWLREHGGRPAAYFVPASALHALDSLACQESH